MAGMVMSDSRQEVAIGSNGSVHAVLVLENQINSLEQQVHLVAESPVSE
jgi:hypothetical protein